MQTATHSPAELTPTPTTAAPIADTRRLLGWTPYQPVEVLAARLPGRYGRRPSDVIYHVATHGTYQTDGWRCGSYRGADLAGVIADMEGETARRRRGRVIAALADELDRNRRSLTVQTPDAAWRRRQAARARLEALALHVAGRYHHTVRSLYESSRAEIEIGPARQVEAWDVYSKAHHRRYGPCRWHNAGAEISRGVITLHPVRGADVTLPRIPVDLLREATRKGAPARHPAGLLATRTADAGVVACWAPVVGRWQCVGLAIGGVIVPQAVAAGRYTAADVLAETNQEVRAIMARRYSGGPEALVRDCGLTPVQSDSRGDLYEMPGGRQRMVRVTDATPGPDGQAKQYWLSVPPTCQTAAEAVAWTFGLAADQYRPGQEA